MNRRVFRTIFLPALAWALIFPGCSVLSVREDADVGAEAIDGGAGRDFVHLRIDFNKQVRTVVIQLDPKSAPQTCANFRKLAESDYYTGIAFHRAIPNYLVQSGDPLTRDEARRAAWGTGGPGYTVPAEIGLKHRRGAVAMARLGNDQNPEQVSNGSQFYVCLANIPTLDDGYTVFGTITSGMDVLDEIAALPADVNDVPRRRVEIVGTALVDETAPVAKPQPSEKKTTPKPGADAGEKGFLERAIKRVW